MCSAEHVRNTQPESQVFWSGETSMTLVNVCRILGRYLQRPVMVDRPMKPTAVEQWCERVKQYVNTTNAYGKSNLHHHVRSWELSPL